MFPEIVIDTGLSAPVSSRPYSISEHKCQVIRTRCQGRLKEGIITPSILCRANPVVVVHKNLPGGSFKHPPPL